MGSKTLTAGQLARLEEIESKMVELGGCSWDFSKLKEIMPDEGVQPNDEGSYSHCRLLYLGTYTDTPSSKIYMPWSSNVTEAEAERDEEWLSLLEEAADIIGYGIDCRDGDYFLAEYFDDDRDDEEVSDDDQYGEGGSDCGDSAAY